MALAGGATAQVLISDYTMTVVFATHTEGEDALDWSNNSDLPKIPELDKAVGALSPELRGDLSFVGCNSIGSGPRRLVLFILPDDIEEVLTTDGEIRFQQPAEGAVAYIQRRGKWDRLPPDASVSKRLIVLGKKPGFTPEHVVEDARGSFIGRALGSKLDANDVIAGSGWRS
jgi:hypothetical protein